MKFPVALGSDRVGALYLTRLPFLGYQSAFFSSATLVQSLFHRVLSKTRSMDEITFLTNPIVTVEQLSTSSSQLDGIPADLESSLRYAGAQLTQAAGILLRLSQESTVKAIVLLYRFYVGAEGGSFRINSVKDVSAACIYLVAKSSFEPLSPRSVLNVYAYLTSSASCLRATAHASKAPDPDVYYLSEGSYLAQKNILFQTETIVLRTLGFSTQVIGPHHLALTYLQTLGILASPPTERSTALGSRVLAYLNAAIFSPQLLYLTHQPSALAVSAIYLAAREVAVPVASEAWWEIFDVDREELGFLTVGLLSCESWMRKEKAKWSSRDCPLDLNELEREMRFREREGQISEPAQAI